MMWMIFEEWSCPAINYQSLDSIYSVLIWFCVVKYDLLVKWIHFWDKIICQNYNLRSEHCFCPFFMKLITWWCQWRLHSSSVFFFSVDRWDYYRSIPFSCIFFLQIYSLTLGFSIYVTGEVINILSSMDWLTFGTLRLLVLLSVFGSQYYITIGTIALDTGLKGYWSQLCY